MSEPTLVERLDNIVDGYYSDSEDYKVLKEALQRVDDYNSIVENMKTEDIGERGMPAPVELTAQDYKEWTDDYGDLKEPMA